MGGSFPPEVAAVWATVTRNSKTPLSDIRRVGSGKEPSKVEDLINALVEIAALADEACIGVGIPDEDGKAGNAFEQKANAQLVNHPAQEDRSSTLCLNIDPSILAVLPKLHTPQNGITLRSLTHNLALVVSPEVKIAWNWAPPRDSTKKDLQHGVNALILPLPEKIAPCAFIQTKPALGRLRNMPRKYGFFTYGNALGPGWISDLEKIVMAANDCVQRIDLVILPELALNDKQLDELGELMITQKSPPMIVCGVALEPRNSNEFPRNTCVTLSLAETPKGSKPTYVRTIQDKHHRWRLDARQIKQYGLGSRLDPSRNWWEACSVFNREINFHAVSPWLTLCTLICEDLARPDPIADVVRSIGPNLVIALLMDGPQLSNRWPARYASVLADDPGSSVLTVTSLGMAQLSTPPGCTPSRVVALWKDAISGVNREIELPPRSQGIVICMTRETSEEFSADGRGDGESTAHVTLSGVHALSV